MTSFYYYNYYYQNAAVFCFLVQIRAFVVLNLAGITKFKYERKNEMDFGSSSKNKWRHRANGVLANI